MSRLVFFILLCILPQVLFALEHDDKNLLALDYVKAPVELKSFEKTFKRHLYEVLMTTQRYQFIIGDVDPDNLKTRKQINMLKIDIGREPNQEFSIALEILGKVPSPGLRKVEYIHLKRRQIPYAFRLGLYELILGKDFVNQIHDVQTEQIKKELTTAQQIDNSSLSPQAKQFNTSSQDTKSSRTSEPPSNTETSFDSDSNQSANNNSSSEAMTSTSTNVPKSKTTKIFIPNNKIDDISSDSNQETDSDANEQNQRTAHGRFIYEALPPTLKSPKPAPKNTPIEQLTIIKADNKIQIAREQKPTQVKAKSPNLKKIPTNANTNWGINISLSPFVGTSFHLIQTDWILKTRTNYSKKSIGGNVLLNLFDDQSVDYKLHIGLSYVSKIKNFPAFLDKEMNLSALSKDSVAPNIDIGMAFENSSFYFAGADTYGAELTLIKNSFFWVSPLMRFRYGSPSKFLGQFLAYLSKSFWGQSDLGSIQLSATKAGFQNEVRWRNESAILYYEYLNFSGETSNNNKISGTGSSIGFNYSHYFF